MIKYLSILVSLFWVSVCWASTEAYDYPVENKWLATVVGTPPDLKADYPEKIPLKKRRIVIFKEREVPEALWYEREFRYSYALQKKNAPLIFIIAGTGSAHDGIRNIKLCKAFYQAGFHVVSLSSPTHSNFIVAASTTSVPGHAYKDAEDLYRVMERTWEKLGKRAEVTDFYVTGYSLGGLNAAFVSELDEEKKTFNFKKALMLNPPVRLYNSASLLDRMIENIPGGIDNFPQFYNRVINQISKVYRQADTVHIDDDFLYKAFEAVNPENEELAALIGLSFRITSANMAFTSDLMTNYGYIKPSNVFLTKNSSPKEYLKVANRLGFTDYYHSFFYPYFKEKDSLFTRESLDQLMSLESIEEYLRNSDKVELITNRDDIILAPGEIDFFSRVFGKRAKIYPTGGHCGNMDHRDYVAHMINVLK